MQKKKLWSESRIRRAQKVEKQEKKKWKHLIDHHRHRHCRRRQSTDGALSTRRTRNEFSIEFFLLPSSCYTSPELNHLVNSSVFLAHTLCVALALALASSLIDVWTDTIKKSNEKIHFGRSFAQCVSCITQDDVVNGTIINMCKSQV